MSALPASGPGTDGPLVIGVGNGVRGDDAAGLRVSRELRPLVGHRARIVECGGEVTELLDLWEGQDMVYLVDAVRSGGAPGSWHRIPVGDEPLPSTLEGASTHGLSIATAVALGQVLGRMPTRLVVYGIEAVRFEPGSEPSPEVLAGIERVTHALAEELTQEASSPPNPGGE
jgi:hydrogenase maturation protease